MEKIDNITPFNNSIHFKELNKADFEGYKFEEDKIIIKPDANGYISKTLNEVINLEKSNTTVINAGVGQGKTTAIIDLLKWCINQNREYQQKYKIVIVTPFKTLNSAYIDKINKKIEVDICFDYQELEKEEVNKESYATFSEKPIQLISINSILRNPGTVSHKQSSIKSEYYDYLINRCKAENQKVILVYDEIHESLNSFQTKFIPNLFKWEEVIHKVIVASATFSESSKTVIKLLANLTDKNLKIIESEREQQTNRLSELHLCFYNQFYFKQDDQYIKDLIELELSEASTVNILCFSRKLAKNIYNSSIGEMLKEKFGKVKLCTGGDNDFFDPDVCNIGTRFKTGVSIEKENSLFILILPLRFAYSDNTKESLGIFTDRINSLIQGLARPRNKSKILVITPPPDKLILPNKLPNGYIKKLSLGYFNFDDILYQTKFKSLQKQSYYLKEIYKNRRSDIEQEIIKAGSLHEGLQSNFPPYDWFALQEGDSILRTKSDSYGKNLSNYLYWAAWNNQFVNCKLKSIIKVSSYIFEENSIQESLNNYFDETFHTDAFFTLNSDKKCYHKIRNTLFSNSLYQKKSKELYVISPYKNSNFEQQLITFIQRMKKPMNFNIRKKVFPPNGDFYKYKDGKVVSLKIPKDLRIDKLTYFKLAMAHCTTIETPPEKLNENERILIDSYNRLYEFKNILLSEYADKHKENIYLPQPKKFQFKGTHKIQIEAILLSLIKNDSILKAFDIRERNFDKEISIYKLLKDLFFETKPTTRDKTKVLKIVKELPLINTSEYINLIYNVEDAWLEQIGTGYVEKDDFTFL